MQPPTGVELLVGPETADDAAVFRLPSGELVAQSVDFFTPIVDEAYDWGRIAAANALSDIYAMGGEPLTALQLIGWPRDELSFDLLGEVVEGGQEILTKAGCSIVGGHSIDDQEPKYGFAVTGLVQPDRLVTNAGAKPGDDLVLTKPLGTGIIATGIKRDLAARSVRDEAVRIMVTLNEGASRAMAGLDVHATTDVTGFWLLGHLGEIVKASGVSASIDAGAVPVIEGVRELASAGVFPGGSRRNLASAERYCRFRGTDEVTNKVLADAQTSGGLLIAVDPADTEALVGALLAAEAPAADIIGSLHEVTSGQPTIDVRG